MRRALDSGASRDFEELTRIVNMGEGDFVEFKRRVPEPQRIAKEIVAFANTSGGRLLLGVDDAGVIAGLKDPEEQIFLLNSALEEATDPTVKVALRRVRVSRKREVVVATVSRSPERPHFVVGAHQRTAYVRIGEKSLEASREAVRLMRASARPEEVSFEFGDKELLLMRYLDQYGRITVDQFARLADIRRKQASHTLVLLTRGNVLAFHSAEGGDFFTAAPRRD